MKLQSSFLFVPLMLITVFPMLGQEKRAAQKEESVKPGINERFLDPELKVDDWLKRCEVESCEVFQEREVVLKVCGIGREIEKTGLTFVEELKIEGFEENYFLRFRRE